MKGKTARNLTLALLILLGSFSAAAYFIFNFAGGKQVEENVSFGDQSAPAGSVEKFDYLAAQKSNGCGLQRNVVFGYSDDQRIQGSCCDKMDQHAYQGQIEGLKKYEDLSFIPKDPYDISAAQAKVAYEFLDNITLSSDQQEVYKEAAEMSMEGGPCCCKCWHWDVYEGFAKKLITDYNWTAEQIAELWDISDACGGAGQEHG